MRNLNQLIHLSVAMVGFLSMSACGTVSDSLDEPDLGAVSQAVCSSTDLDAGATCNTCGTTVRGYAGAVGYQHFWWPSSVQLYCEFPIDDYRIYWTDATVANPANPGRIELRYLGGNPRCNQAPYAADYLSRNGSRYLRVTLSSNPGGLGTCNPGDYVMVGP